jgi:hypothetical protein
MKKGFDLSKPFEYGGGLRIRTLGGDKPSTVFKTAAFDHSASPPKNYVCFTCLASAVQAKCKCLHRSSKQADYTAMK